MGGGVVILISLLSRGFGFVTFVDQAGVDKVLAQTRHELDSKTVSFNHIKLLRSVVKQSSVMSSNSVFTLDLNKLWCDCYVH